MQFIRGLGLIGMLGLGTLLSTPASPAQACGHGNAYSLGGGFGDASGINVPNALGLGAGLLASSVAAVVFYKQWENVQAKGSNIGTEEAAMITHPEMLEVLDTQKVLTGAQK